MLPEVALSSILLIVIVLFPGLIFRRFYYWSKFTKQFVKGEWSERIVTSIFWGIISQVITLLLISYILSILQIKLLEKDIIEKIRDFSFANMDIEEARSLLFFILGYILFSILVAGLLGLILYKFVRWFEIDIRIEAFRYSNQWHYIFQGEVPKSKKKVLFPWVDVTLITQQEDGKQKMIQGVLKDYQINATSGDLEYLYLEKAERYSHTQKDFKKILSDIFVIPSQNIVDLNIRYKYKNEENNIEKVEDEKNIETNKGDQKNVETKQEEEKNIEKVEKEKEIRAKQRKELFLARFTLFMIIVYILSPWIIAKEGVIWWKKILSYFPLFICFILITGGFIHIVSGKSKNWFFTIMVIFLFSYLCWRAASLLLL